MKPEEAEKLKAMIFVPTKSSTLEWWDRVETAIDSMTEPAPFERGDRVRDNSGPYKGEEADVLRVRKDNVSDRIVEMRLRYDNGKEMDVFGADKFTPITPARKRPIEVGDTFSCSFSCAHEAGAEFVAKEIGSVIIDTDGRGHDRCDCIFRARPLPPKDEWKVGDEAAYIAGNHTMIITVGSVSNGWINTKDNHLSYPVSACRRVLSLQLDGEPVRPGMWVRTPEKWIGIITYQCPDGKYHVDEPTFQGGEGWFFASDLTPTSKPEGI